MRFLMLICVVLASIVHVPVQAESLHEIKLKNGKTKKRIMRSEKVARQMRERSEKAAQDSVEMDPEGDVLTQLDVEDKPTSLAQMVKDAVSLGISDHELEAHLEMINKGKMALAEWIASEKGKVSSEESYVEEESEVEDEHQEGNAEKVKETTDEGTSPWFCVVDGHNNVLGPYSSVSWARNQLNNVASKGGSRMVCEMTSSGPKSDPHLVGQLSQHIDTGGFNKWWSGWGDIGRMNGLCNANNACKNGPPQAYNPTYSVDSSLHKKNGVQVPQAPTHASNQATSFSVSQIPSLASSLWHFDTNGDGQLSLGEFNNALSQPANQGLTQTISQITDISYSTDSLFWDIDADKNGRITQTEFTVFLVGCCSPGMR